MASRTSATPVASSSPKHSMASNGIEAQILIDLFPHPIGVGGGQVDLVDDRNELEVVFERQIEVGNGLRFDPPEMRRSGSGRPRRTSAMRRTSCEKSTWPGVSIRLSSVALVPSEAS